MPRRSINNFGDVQIALNDINDILDSLTVKGVDWKQRILTGIPTPSKDLDAVNYTTLKSYVDSQIEDIKKLIPPKQKLDSPANAPSTSFASSLLPKTTNLYSIGSSALFWLKGWFTNLNVAGLTASSPVRTDASKNLASGKIDLANTTTDVTGILAKANGGTGTTDVVISFNTRTGAVTLTSGDLTTLNAVLTGSSPTLNALTAATLTMLGLAALNSVQFTTGNTTGAGSAVLGANCPAITLTAPYKWLTVLASDGSTVYIPAWK